MSNYLTNFYTSKIQTPLTESTESDHHQQPCKYSFIYGSGKFNSALGIPKEAETIVKRVLPCSCLINTIKGKTNMNYTDHPLELYYDDDEGMIDDEFVEDISNGGSGSAFLTSKGRIFTSYTFASVIVGDKKVLTNEGMVVELNLENVREMELKYSTNHNNNHPGYSFGVKQVCVLSNDLCIVTNIGLVWMFTKTNGWNLLEFQNENEMVKIKYITSGLQHLMALSENGELFSASQYENYGACGMKTAIGTEYTVHRSIIQLQSDDSILDVYAGYYRTLIVTKFGKLYCSGWGMFHQHSIGHDKDIYSFTLHKPMEETGEKIVKVALGASHSICLCESGNCWALGYNSYEQSGVESASGDSHLFPVLIPLSNKIRDVFCGWHFSIIQTVEGEFMGVGSNVVGELSSISNSDSLDSESFDQFTIMQLPKPPVHEDDGISQIVWRIYVSSFSSNVLYMGRLVMNKRTMWMKQNLKNLSKNPLLLSDITICHRLINLQTSDLMF